MSLLKEPTSKRTWGDRSFSVTALRLWNHLPTKLKSCQGITRFKSLLKTHLMSQFFKDDVYLNCIVHVSRYIIIFLCYHRKLFVLLFLLCFRALSTQQGGYVRTTNMYYYYGLEIMQPGSYFSIFSNYNYIPCKWSGGKHCRPLICQHLAARRTGRQAWCQTQ